MKIELRADHSLEDARADTGRTLAEWFALLDAFGGPGKGRREIGNHLYDAYRLDPWWISTLNIEYEAARGLRDKDGRPRGYAICATKSIKATPRACYDAFASAPALDCWLGPGHALDFREGGELANADGNRAQLRKLNSGKSIRLAWRHEDGAADTPVEVKLQPAGARTSVVVTHERLPTRAAADGFRRAWAEALERLKAVLEA